MPIYTVVNEETGDTLKFEWFGETEPTDSDIDEIFSDLKNGPPIPKTTPIPFPGLVEKIGEATTPTGEIAPEVTPELLKQAPQGYIPPQSTIESTIRGNRIPTETISPGEQSDVGTAPYQEVRETPIPENAPSRVLTEPTISYPENQGDVGIGQFQPPDVFIPETEFPEGQSPEVIVPEGTIPTRPPLPDVPASAGLIGFIDALPGLEMTGSDVEALKKKFGNEYIAGNILSNIGTSMLGGAGMANMLKGSIQNPFLLNALARIGTALTIGGTQQLEEVAKGRKEIGDALFDTVIVSAGSAVFSMFPEMVFPSKYAQPLVQGLADLIYQAGVDTVKKGDTEVLSEEWFKEQIPNLAMNIGFSLLDVNDPNFKQNQKNMRKGLQSIWEKKPWSKPKTTIISSKTKADLSLNTPENVRQKAPDVTQEEAQVIAKIPEPDPENKANVLPSEDPEMFRPLPQGQSGGFADVSKGKPENNELQNFLRRYFIARKNLPESVFNRSLEKEGAINEILLQAEYTLRDLKKATKKEYGKLTDEQQFQIDQALKGNQEALDNLSPETQSLVTKMRGQIDNLSTELANLPMDPNLSASQKRQWKNMRDVITNNIGNYANRSYQIFDEGKAYIKRVKKTAPEKIEKAKDFIRKEFEENNIEYDEDMVEGELNRWLFQGDKPEDIFQAINSLGERNVKILKKRKEIPSEMRDLWGEYQRADVNFLKTVTSLANLVENSKMLTDIKNQGLGEFLFESPRGRFATPIKTTVGQGKSPLDGLYTTPEIAESFKNFNQNDPKGSWAFRLYMKAIGITKYSKTVLNHMTHLRNLTGNAGFAIANGHWMIHKSGKIAQLIGQKINNPEEYRKYMLKLTRLNVIGQDVRGNELAQVLKDANGDLSKIQDSRLAKIIKKPLRAINKTYLIEDDVSKIYAFENEKARYGKALPDATEEEIEKIAADIVQQTYQNYSRLPSAIKGLRKMPFGTFVGFPWEVFRTTVNTVRLAQKELKDPKLRKIGLQRVAGIISAAGITGAAAYLQKKRLGISEQEDNDLRLFMPPWAKNQQIIYRGNRTYTNLGYQDPHSSLKSLVIPMLRGEDVENKALESIGEFFEPFISEEILIKKIREFRSNKKDRGGKVYFEDSDNDKKFVDVFTHFADAITPGSVNSLKRLYDKYEDRKKGSDFKQELFKNLSGISTVKIDVPKSLFFKAREFVNKLPDVKKAKYEQPDMFSELTGASTGEKLSQEIKQTVYNDFKKYIEAAKRLNVSEREIRRILDKAGIRVRDINRLMRGK